MLGFLSLLPPPPSSPLPSLPLLSSSPPPQVGRLQWEDPSNHLRSFAFLFFLFKLFYLACLYKGFRTDAGLYTQTPAPELSECQTALDQVCSIRTNVRSLCCSFSCQSPSRQYLFTSQEYDVVMWPLSSGSGSSCSNCWHYWLVNMSLSYHLCAFLLHCNLL